jgi:hypothetical protein
VVFEEPELVFALVLGVAVSVRQIFGDLNAAVSDLADDFDLAFDAHA